ncbi:MAG: hypothetical protein ACRDYU_03780 [Actinomycetes bacterium]
MSPRPSKVDADEVRRLRAMGETDAAIATRHGVTVGAVQRTIERHPLEKRGGAWLR